MRTYKVEQPIELSRFNDSVVLNDLLEPLYNNLKQGNVIKSGALANNASDEQSEYVEIIGKQLLLDPYSPFIYLNKAFSTPKKYFKAELEWYKSEDLSINGHDMISDNETWISCASKDNDRRINSNYGWCVFSSENGSQYDNCLKYLARSPDTRNAIIVYNRPSIYKDMVENGKHDMICTMYSHFFIRNGRLEMIHNMRSNDVRFGFICSDLAWNCFVYQNMLEDLKSFYPDLQPSLIRWTSDSMHLYKRHYNDLTDVIENAMRIDQLRGDLCY